MTVAVTFAREGELLRHRGETEAALRLLEEGARRFPADVTGRLVLARVYRETGRAREARDWLERVLRDDPECPSARFQLAEILGGVEAEFHFGKLRAQEPWDEEFALGAGDLESLTSGPAADPFTEIPPSPTPGASMDLAAYENEFDEDEAEAEIDVDSLPHVATATLAEIYLQQGLKEQAAQIFRQLLELQPGDATLIRRLEEIESSESSPAEAP